MSSNALRLSLTFLAFGGLAFASEAPLSKGMISDPPSFTSLSERQLSMGLTDFDSCSLVVRASDDSGLTTLAIMGMEDLASSRLEDMGITVKSSVTQMSDYMKADRQTDEEVLVANDRFKSAVSIELLLGRSGDRVYFGTVSLEVKRAGFIHPGRFKQVGVWSETTLFAHDLSLLNDHLKELLGTQLDKLEKDWKICNPVLAQQSASNGLILEMNSIGFLGS
jgi:hypothetical protein